MVFWVLDDSVLPTGSRLIQKDSHSGDKCHHNITDIPKTAARQLFKRQDWRSFFVCRNGHYDHLTENDVARFAQG